MDYKKELNILVEIVKKARKPNGLKYTRKDFAEKMGFKNETYWSQLLGEGGTVTEDHLIKFKSKFNDELKSAGIPVAGDPLNEERALMLAMVSDYVERMAKIEKVDKKIVETRLDEKAKLILKGLNAHRG